MTGQLAGFVAELGRRKVVQVTVAYAAIAWLLMQVVDLSLEAFEAPSWVMQALLVVLVLGLPIVVALSWIFDLTPQGVKRTAPRERIAAHHDTLSAVLAISPASEGAFARAIRRELKAHCERYGSTSTQSTANGLIAQFDNAHEGLYCTLFLQSLMHARLPCRAGLAIGEAGRHGRRLVGDAVDDALEVGQHAPAGGLAVTSAFYDSILDRPGSPLQERMQPSGESVDGHPAKVYVVAHEQLSEPAVQSWQQAEKPETVSSGIWVRATGIVLLAAIGLALWRWLPDVELPGLQPSIAVLPFRDLSRDEGNQWFVAGLGEEVLTTIAGIGGLRVVSRSTTLEYQPEEKDISEIGKELGVNHLLEGSVSREGERIRINMRLSRTADGSIRWANGYDALPEDLNSVMRDITRSLASSLQVALTEAETTRLRRASDVSSEAYTSYLEAIGYLRQPPSTESLGQAQSRLSEVVASEPGFHEALAALCQTNLQWYRLTQDASYFDLAQQQCGIVLQANRENVGAMLALGQLYIAKGDATKAIEYLRRGLGLDSDDVELQAGMARALRMQGDREGAEALLQQAIRIEPGSWGLHSDLGALYLSWGRNSEAVAAYDRAFDLVPDNASVLGNLGSAYYYLGEFRKAALAYERSLEFNPTASAYSNIATLWFYEHSFERAREYYEKAAEMTPRDYRVWSNLADAESQISGMEDPARAHYREALDMADELLHINPGNAEALSVSAWCAANLGLKDSARQRIEEAERLAADDPNISYVAATVYAALDDQKRMQKAVDRSIGSGFPRQILRATPILGRRLEFVSSDRSRGEA